MTKGFAAAAQATSRAGAMVPSACRAVETVTLTHSGAGIESGSTSVVFGLSGTPIAAS